MTARLNVFGAPSVLPGILPVTNPVIIEPGMRPYFLSALGGALGGLNGAVTIDSVTITVLAGTALTIGGSDWPDACETWDVPRRIGFVSTLGPVVLMWGPVGAKGASIDDIARLMREHGYGR